MPVILSLGQLNWEDGESQVSLAIAKPCLKKELEFSFLINFGGGSFDFMCVCVYFVLFL